MREQLKNLDRKMRNLTARRQCTELCIQEIVLIDYIYQEKKEKGVWYQLKIVKTRQNKTR